MGRREPASGQWLHRIVSQKALEYHEANFPKNSQVRIPVNSHGMGLREEATNLQTK
jgi:hypothetical protein